MERLLLSVCSLSNLQNGLYPSHHSCRREFDFIPFLDPSKVGFSSICLSGVFHLFEDILNIKATELLTLIRRFQTLAKERTLSRSSTLEPTNQKSRNIIYAFEKGCFVYDLEVYRRQDRKVEAVPSGPRET